MQRIRVRFRDSKDEKVIPLAGNLILTIKRTFKLQLPPHYLFISKNPSTTYDPSMRKWEEELLNSLSNNDTVYVSAMPFRVGNLLVIQFKK
jgi:hypothetical protein